MIDIKLLTDSNGLCGFKCLGHAGFDKTGKDIVCAAASSLIINTVNSIVGICGRDTSLETDRVSGKIDFSIEDPDDNSRLLLKVMAKGMRDLQEQYPDNVKVTGY